MLAQGEVFAEIVEYDCPRCSEKVTFAPFPTREETAAAAQSGNEEAATALPSFDERDRRWKRVLETQGSSVLDPPELAEGDVDCALKLESGGDDTWLVLMANGQELHRELAVFESTEPARRLLAVMRERYGDRLRSFDYQPALVYLGGDRPGAVGELQSLVSDLAEPNRCKDCHERTLRNQRGRCVQPHSQSGSRYWGRRTARKHRRAGAISRTRAERTLELQNIFSPNRCLPFCLRGAMPALRRDLALGLLRGLRLGANRGGVGRATVGLATADL